MNAWLDRTPTPRRTPRAYESVFTKECDGKRQLLTTVCVRRSGWWEEVEVLGYLGSAEIVKLQMYLRSVESTVCEGFFRTRLRVFGTDRAYITSVKLIAISLRVNTTVPAIKV